MISKNVSTAERIATLRRTRLLNAEALRESLSSLALVEPSERTLAEEWHGRLRRAGGLLDDGWYLPPPHGVIVFTYGGSRPHQPTSFRGPETWPSNQRRLAFDDGIWLYAYASPVDRDTGVIGDFGVTLHRPIEPRAREHLRRCWALTRAVAENAQVEMEFRELFSLSERLAQAAGLRNIVHSVTDPAMANIGHSIPWVSEPPSEEEAQALASGNPHRVASSVSGRRRFINRTERSRIEPNCAFTVEPRLDGQELPTVSFHLLVTFEEGRREVEIGSFRPLFELFGMELL